MTASGLRSLGAGGLLLAAGLFGVACGSSSTKARTLNVAKVETAIVRSILKERSLTATVECPGSVPQRSGYKFTCQAVLDAGAYPVSVIETDGNGHVRYENAHPLLVLDVAKVEQAIEASVYSQRRLHATARCPAEVLQAAGVTFDCSATVGISSHRYPFRVTEIDAHGHVRYVGT
jgi:hypothetical protein